MAQGTEEQKAQGRQVLTEVLEAIRVVALLLSPVTPTLSRAVHTQLGFSEDESRALALAAASWGGANSAKLPAFACRAAQDATTTGEKRGCHNGLHYSLGTSILYSWHRVVLIMAHWQRHRLQTHYVVCAGLKAGQQTAKPTPVFTRLEQDFVTEPAKKPELAAVAP